MLLQAEPFSDGASPQQSFQSLTGAQQVVDSSAKIYQREIKPVLTERCYACHGSLKQEGNLRLDTVQAMRLGGDSGAAIVAGDRDNSLILQRVTSDQPDTRMPHEGEPLSAKQIQAIREWIEAGAPAPQQDDPESDPRDHWAFQPIQRPVVPDDITGWSLNPVDAFIAARHRQHGLLPQPAASDSLLVRRLYIDLIGVPPTFAELAQVDMGQPDWYPRLVDRLLADTRYGQRWARHWMDIWRYSDWWGLGDQLRNSQYHMWHWRDWIVQSLNQDLSLDEMIRQMLAADELYPGDVDKLRATGYLARNYFLFNRNPWMEETVEHVGKSLLGLTMNCAKCHDHKYDPIDQRDFYRFRAFFEPYHVRLDMLPGETDFNRNGLPRVFDGWLDAPTYLYHRGDENQPDKSQSLAAGVPKILEFKPLAIRPVSLPRSAWQPELQPWVVANYIADAEKKLQQLHSQESELKEIELQVARSELENLRLQARYLQGHDDPTALEALRAELIQSQRQLSLLLAQRNLADLESKKAKAEPDKQKDLQTQIDSAAQSLAQAQLQLEAEISSSQQPQSIIGARWTPTRFLTSTADDPEVKFPAQSSGRRTALAQWITDRNHPLTARVAVNHIWNRHFGRPIVSSVFDFGRNGAAPSHPELLDWLACELMDENWSLKHLHRLLVNSAVYKLSSSNLDGQDNLLKDPDNRWWWRRDPIRVESQVVRDAVLHLADELDDQLDGPSVPLSEQTQSRRRSLYFFHSNNERNSFLAQFDDASVKECYRRDQSIVPQQALAQANSRLVLEAAEKIVKQIEVRGQCADNDHSFVEQAFALILGSACKPEESQACLMALKHCQQSLHQSPQQARQILIWTLLNHNDFITLR